MPERSTQVGETHVDRLVSDDPVEVQGVDLEVCRRQLDGGSAEVPPGSVDEGATRSLQSVVPPDGNHGPHAESDGTPDRIEGRSVGAFELAGR